MSQSQNSRKAQNGREKDSRYRGTVFLPETSFAMRGNLPVREPEILKFWKEIDLDGRIKAQGAQRKEAFFLHDGPPYANGRIHIGHALNKISKDVINRAQRMSGKEVRYLPGWDCHGLPIEWEIEKKQRIKDTSRVVVAGHRVENWSVRDLPVLPFRGACREYAAEQVEIQKADFQRLGVQAEWANAYITMDLPTEARIAAEIGKFLLNGLLYSDLRPVMWSVAERTALAEAEVEYKEIDSTALFVAFPICKDPTGGRLKDVAALIWTTTPWTTPLNQALAYGPEIDYAVIEAVSRSEGSLVPEKARLLVAEELLESVMAKLALTEVRILHRLKGVELAGAQTTHPFAFRSFDNKLLWSREQEQSVRCWYDRPRPLLAGNFVTAEAGTGLVHIAPAHGEDDFHLAKKAGLKIYMGVREDGLYEDWTGLSRDQTGQLSAQYIFEAERTLGGSWWQSVRQEAVKHGKTAGLVASEKITHSYPHSWRSGAPLIYRATPQWFIALDKPGFSGKTLRQKALAALENTKFIPEQSRNRLTSMVSQRPDWCISRQRVWGVPLPIFTEKSSGLPLRDPAVIKRIVQAFAKEGADCWYEENAKARFLGEDYNPEDYDQASDIVDVWFESGSSHEFLPKEKGLEFPADLYLEGSDQHRGWFQSSLLEGLGAEGESPFRALLTQGFVLDGKGRKMSKSLGNVIAPESVSQKYGADILRLWAANTDASGDVRVDDGILRQQGEIYRRLRNTLRWMLGALKGWNPAHAVPYADLPEPEKYILHGLTGLWEKISGALETHDWNGVYPAVHDFCNLDLSAFYFDIRKDAVYCETPDSPERRAVMTTLDLLAQALITWLAPVLAFTAEDAFQARLRDRGVEDGRDSVHLQEFFRPHAPWRDADLGARWEKIRQVRRGITTALENARNEGVIRSSLEAQVVLPLTEEEKALAPEACEARFWEALAIVSRVQLTNAQDGAEVEVARASGEKCARCWKVLEEVGESAEHPELCGRCAEAVMKLEKAAAP